MIGNYLLLHLFASLGCFISDTVGREAIVGGHEATEHQFPYQVSVLHEYHVCGGGILSNLFILTAAHCVINDNNGRFYTGDLSIVAGTNDLRRYVKTSVFINVSIIYVPTGYKPPIGISTADIAILKLKEHLDLHKHAHLKKLELPYNVLETYAAKHATIAGFGYSDINSINPHGLLRFAEANVLDINQCKHNYPSGRISERHLCARVEHGLTFQPGGACSGDSGSPLVYNKHVVIGVLSRIPSGCNENRFPGVYTRVTEYLDFIDNVMHERHDPGIAIYYVYYH